VLTSFDASGNWDTRAWGVVIQSSGKIVVAGERGSAVETSPAASCSSATAGKAASTEALDTAAKC
jgi:hypothetical protein